MTSSSAADNNNNNNNNNNNSADQAYLAFLDKANEDPAKGSSSVSAAATGSENMTPKAEGRGFRTTQAGVEVPAPLARLCARDVFYVSDADEPFEPVAIRWEDDAGRGLPDEGRSLSLPISFSISLSLSLSLFRLS
jgi:hypothetical protein